MLLLATSAAATMVVVSAYAQAVKETKDALDTKRYRAGCIRACGALWWPAVLAAIVPHDDRGCRACLLPLGWMLVVHVLDMYLLFHAPSADTTGEKPASLRLDPMCLSGVAFGLCGVLGASADGRYRHLFLYAVVAFVATVLPTHNLQPGCVEEQIFESVQKTLVLYCIGLLLAGVALTRKSILI